VTKQRSFILNKWADLTKEVEPTQSESIRGYQTHSFDNKENGGEIQYNEMHGRNRNNKKIQYFSTSCRILKRYDFFNLDFLFFVLSLANVFFAAVEMSKSCHPGTMIGLESRQRMFEMNCFFQIRIFMYSCTRK
jgi:hypothetical protein